jgi:hypothetical protein
MCVPCALWRAASSPHRLDRGSESIRLVRWEPEGIRESRGGLTEGVRDAAFELLNAIHAQTRALGERRLSETGCDTVLSQQGAEAARRFS